MSKDTRSRFKAWTTLSDSHSRRDLPGHNPLYNKTQPLLQEMNAKSNPERAQQQADMQKSEAERRRDMQEQLERREAFMVKRQKPSPVLKPSHVMSHGVDRAIFNNEWQRECWKAKRRSERGEQHVLQRTDNPRRGNHDH